MIRRPLLLATVLSLAAAGCDLPDNRGPSTRPSQLLNTTSHFIGTINGPTAIHMDVYLLDVPAGSISGDESFWRTVDENAVGAGADQRLLANGIRCGVAPRNQWPHFAEIFSRDLSRARRTKVDGMSTDRVQLEVDQPVDREDVFFLNADHQLEGRTYDRATNGIAMTFGPTPREPGWVRLTLCPIVRRERSLLQYTPTNESYETPVTDVDRIYDAGLTADVPPDGFLIIAPGPLADPDTTLGGRFLLRREAASRREQVIVAVPTVVPLNAVPME